MSDLDYFLQKKELLEEKLKVDKANWDCRKELAHLLYNQGYTKEAAELVWNAPEIPSVDLEIAFAAKIVGKSRPARAIRLLNAVQEINKGKAVQNLGLANALLHHGMVMQAARFYGAAIELDPEMVNPDLEHFLLWIDDSQKLWGDFKDELPKLEELPWISRDADEAKRLKKSMAGHTTPISIPGLQKAAAEEAIHAAYIQSDKLRAKTTPPPSVTIPMDRVNPKDMIIDNERGAGPPQPQVAAYEPVSQSIGTPLPVAPISEPLRPVPIIHPNGQTVRSLSPQNGHSGPATRPTPSQPLIPIPVATQPLIPSPVGTQPLIPTPTATQAMIPNPTPTQALGGTNGAQLTRRKHSGALAGGKIQLKRSQ